MCQSNVSSLKSVPIPFQSADREEISGECFLAWGWYRIAKQSQMSLITTFGLELDSCWAFVIFWSHWAIPCELLLVTGASGNLLRLEVQLRNGTTWLWNFAQCTLQLLSLSTISHCDLYLWHLMNKLLKINNT